MLCHRIRIFFFSQSMSIYRIRFNATPGSNFSKLVFGWGSIHIWLPWGCIRDGGLLIDSSFIIIIFDNFSQTLKVKRIKKCHFCMIMKKSRFQTLLIYSAVCFIVSIYFKNSKVGTVGVVFKLGLYYFKISFWLGFYYLLNGVRFYSRVGLHLRGYGT